MAVAAIPDPAIAQAVGSEFQINTYTTGYQSTRSFPGHHLIAPGPDGSFVVVWHGSGQGDAYGIFGQRFDSAGVPQGAEFQVNSYTTSYQNFPAVASDANGNFVVIWASSGQVGSNRVILGQRFDSVGAPRGGEFLVNENTRAQQSAPSVASDASGNFVVVWDSYPDNQGAWEVFGRRYDSGGGPIGNEFRVNSYTASHQHFSSVSSDAAGNFVVVWSSDEQDGDAHGVFGQRYASR